jgi:hypothetical protein
MDAALLTQVVTIGALFVLGMRYAVRTLGHAEAGFASLFVPPDRTLPWPRGVQESDSPWGWRTTPDGDDPPERDVDGLTSDLLMPGLDLEAVVAAPSTGRGRYVAPPHRVDPIRFRTLPQ